MDRSSERCDEWAVRTRVMKWDTVRERANVSHNMFEKKSMRGVRPVSARVARGVSRHWVRECGRGMARKNNVGPA